LINQKVLKA